MLAGRGVLAGGAVAAQCITDLLDVRSQRRDDMKPRAVRISDHNYHSTLAIFITSS